MKITRVCLLLFLFVFSFAIEASPEALALFDAHMYTNDSNDTLLYRMLEPQHRCFLKKYPLVVFLHGSGERGNDNERQLIWGAGAFIREESLKEYPCYVIAPQCPSEKRWLEKHWALPTHDMPEEASETMALVIELIDKIIADYPINEQRIYVSGLSMGGYGTWDLISRLPEKFAAAAPVCGGGDENQAHKLVDMPIWVFHGADDTVVPTDRSRNMVQAIKDAGGTKIKYTEYPGVGHGSWKPAYADPEFLKWMFKQKKRR
jgi:predicted peptidase